MMGVLSSAYRGQLSVKLLSWENNHESSRSKRPVFIIQWLHHYLLWLPLLAVAFVPTPTEVLRAICGRSKLAGIRESKLMEK